MPNDRQYIDLSLELRDLNAADDTFKVTVLPSSVGESERPEVVPYKLDELREALDDLDQKVIEPEELISLGEALAARLLPPGQVRELYLRALAKAGRDGGVRLRLLIREPRLAQLPWEFTYLQTHHGEKNRRHFLCLNPQVSIVRHEAMAEAHQPLTGAAPGKLRVLAAMADAGGLYPLKLKREKRVVLKALENPQVDGVTIELQTFVEHATLASLSRAFLQKADLFHFAGHGVFTKEGNDEAGESKGDGYIVLARDEESDEPYMLPAGDLAAMIQAAGVRVALLGACVSGRRDGVSAWAGVASALVERGTPAVVAMQYEVADTSAIAFSEMFYTSLAAGLTLDEAVAAGRLAMERGSAEDGVEWGVPVLYMRSPDGVIFPQLQEQGAETASRIRGLIELRIKTIEGGATVIGSEGDINDDVRMVIDTVKGKGTKVIGKTINLDRRST